jgi:hypothetical protein
LSAHQQQMVKELERCQLRLLRRPTRSRIR